ncbi:hypothetical protein BBJ29_009426 [Phytophthora kernoviae]|uniref:EF-hand domain-containing protein n=1 Tax=Phytophthora kernoviae TaxID=325452 RepID=A0A3F2RBF6_9STRA|nr:hypothetical protein BBP00_00009835 [Phytophthora kernoviae]RLN66278.1 hypothetical protein BBJ29_009426 [Phytophthora kernoviae]
MMMEGEISAPVVVREPDEETAFVKKKIEAPRRHQNRMRAKKKRLAVASVSVVTLLALAGMCTFLALPSESPNEMKTAVSEAMAADPMNSSQEEGFMPSFDDYDEDGDGKVSLEEYLDCLATNWDAALENVETSSLDDAERAQVEQYLNEDFANHSGCVARFAQQQKQNDGLMTRENFDQVYDQLTTEICPLRDARIPGSMEAK